MLVNRQFAPSKGSTGRSRRRRRALQPAMDVRKRSGRLQVGAAARARRATTRVRHAARTVARNLSTAPLRLALWFASDCAAERTCAAEEPVALAPVLTSAILVAT